MNRLNELNIHVPLVKQEFDRVINSIASWRLTYTTKMEAELAKDLTRLNKKSNKGVHAKTKNSWNKNSKNYKKTYKGQGR